MSGKTKEDKEKEKAKKDSEIKAEADKVAAEKKEKEAADKVEADKVKSEKAEAENKKSGFIKEISEKINEAETIEDLEKLNERVYDIWADKVPVEIQELAFEKGEEIEANKPPAKKVSLKENLQKDWVKVTMSEVKKAEKDGKLAGFDDSTMTALIND